MQKFVAVLPQLAAVTSTAQTAGVEMHKHARRRWPSKGDHMIGANFESYYVTRAPSQPRPKTSFAELADHLRNMEA
jgi:hypothetical protein